MMGADATDERPPVLSRHRLTVSDFQRMGEAGILAEDARLELVEGELIDMTPIGSLHAGTLDRLARLFFRLAGNHIVRVQSPVVLSEHSEVEPDLALLRQRDDFYINRHPGAGDILLLVEIADSSIRYDREVKIPLYAKHGIAEVWLVDLAKKQLNVYSRPSASGYRQIVIPTRGDKIALSLLPQIEIDVADLGIM